MDGFGIVIGGNHNSINVIFCGMKRSKTNLNIQERIWLETLAYFSSILLENFQLIEGLFEKIEGYKGRKKMDNGSYPYWFSRLMFSLSEKERANLSIDLHDSVLQEQLQLLREIEKIKGKVSDISIKNDLIDLKERMLDNIHLIRETCNELRPPFLSELGIIQSIQNLIEQTKLRSDFILKSELDHSIQMMDKEYELTLYRVVQELLNNAMKHSLASEVTVSLRKHNQSLSLIYHDNGIGIDMTQLNDSFKTMGIFGIKERVKSIGGTIDIDSAPGKGTQVFIEIKTGGGEND
jgi:two-component system sensor histidine kinase ComP